MTTTPILNDAASQIDRMADAPHPAQAPADGRSLAQLLAFAGEYGRLIVFYGLNDAPDGDWSVFFISDPTIALATLISLDLPALETDLRRDLRIIGGPGQQSRRLERLRRVFAVLVRLLRILDHSHLSLENAGDALARLIRQEIRHEIAPRLLPVAGHTAATPPHLGLRLDRARLAPHWGLQPADGRGMALAALGGKWFARLMPLLEELTETVLRTLLHLGTEARQALESTLHSDTHAPQAALYIAFCTLFRHAQRTMNSFAEQLVSFYDTTVMAQDSRAAVPGNLCLAFTTAKDVTTAAVPVGTRFSAGKDDRGQEITYTASQPLDVHAVTVSALRTLRVAGGGVIVNDTSAANPEAPSGVLTGTVTLSPRPPAIAAAFPLFGADEAGTSGSLASTGATLGFAVSSPVLLLAGGERTVILTLTIAAASLTDTVNARLSAIAAAAGGISAATALAQVLEGCFTLYCSTARGWVEIPAYTVTPPADQSPEQEQGGTGPQDPSYALSFTLTAGADALTALPAAPAADTRPSPAATPAAAGTLPTVMALFRQQPVAVGTGTTAVRINPYGVVAPLTLSGLTAAVSVGGFTALALSTPAGPVPAASADGTTPFAPFGSPAVQGGTLGIAAAELFAKPLTALSVTLTWYGLPQTSTGFQGYYQGYVVDPDGTVVAPGTLFTNQTFQGAFTVANPGWWDLGTATGTTCLFRTQTGSAEPAAAAPVLGTSRFSPLPVTATTPPAWYDPADGTLCLTLTEPSYAFGDTLYASNVMAAALREMPAAAAAAEICAITCAGSAEVASAAGLLDGVLKANTESTSEEYEDSMTDATGQAVSGLNGVALKAINDGLSTLPADAAKTWRDSLNTTLSQAGGTGGSMLQRLRGNGQPGAASVTAALQDWITANGGSIGATAAGGLEQAQTVLAAAGKVSSARTATAGQPQAVARPVMGASVMTAQSSLTRYHSDTLQACIDGYAGGTGGGPDSVSGSDGSPGTVTLVYPNQPWAPSLSAVSVDYAAQASLPAASGGVGMVYSLLLPFGGAEEEVLSTGGTVPLLAPVADDGALYIGLSGAPAGDAPVLTLLFQLDGSGSPAASPPVEWSQSEAGGWASLTSRGAVVSDGTNGMQNSGIVSLEVTGLAAGADGLCWLQAGTRGGAGSFPLLSGISTNAMIAGWTGPGGAETLDTPLPAGSVIKSDGDLPGIAGITNPMPSSGGRSKATGDSYRVWIGERMRHKNRAVQAWDYTRIILADFPSLWQVAVLAAGSGPGQPPPGTVRVVVVAGPAAAGGSDPAAPMASDSLLAQVRETLGRVVSPFVTVRVENPSYVRIAVTADLTFRNVESPSLLEERLNGDLSAWLSPWPPAGLGPRPADYWTEPAIAEFIRRRPYVAAIRSLSLAYTPGGTRTDAHYLTSAPGHTITGSTAHPRTATVAAVAGGQPAGTEASS